MIKWMMLGFRINLGFGRSNGSRQTTLVPPHQIGLLQWDTAKFAAGKVIRSKSIRISGSGL